MHLLEECGVELVQEALPVILEGLVDRGVGGQVAPVGGAEPVGEVAESDQVGKRGWRLGTTAGVTRIQSARFARRIDGEYKIRGGAYRWR